MQRKSRVHKVRQKYREKRAAETELAKRQRLEQHHIHLLDETSEQPKTRLEVQRARQAQSRTDEMAKQHEARLEVDRARHLQRVQELFGLTTTLEKAINKFCDQACEIRNQTLLSKSDLHS